MALEPNRSGPRDEERLRSRKRGSPWAGFMANAWISLSTGGSLAVPVAEWAFH